MTMATEDDVFAVTGYPIGAVSPLGLSNPLRVLVDESVLREDEISLGSGIRDGKYYFLSADEKHHDGESHDQFQTTRAGFFGNRMGDLHREV
jgi:hypothetical protein